MTDDLKARVAELDQRWRGRMPPADVQQMVSLIRDLAAKVDALTAENDSYEKSEKEYSAALAQSVERIAELTALLQRVQTMNVESLKHGSGALVGKELAQDICDAIKEQGK